VQFTLGAGQYATMMLREFMDVTKRDAPPAKNRHIFFPDSDDDT